MTIEVIAKEAGYYGHYRNPGDIFNVPADEPASTWFTPTKPTKPAKNAEKPADGGLESLKANELKEMLDKQNIKYAGNASKEKLIELLTNPPHPDDADLA